MRHRWSSWRVIMLDERFRQRLRELAALDKEPLPRGARDRIVINVTSRGPAWVRSARRERALFAGGAAVLAAAAAVALLVRFAGSDAQLGGSEGRSAAAAPPAAPATAMSCESRQAPRATFVSADQRRLLDLGELGIASASS